MATGTAALPLIERIENLRTQAIKLLNGADAYVMATTIRDRVADTLKFFDDLGLLFRNGTVAKYMCMEDNTGWQLCDIYALPNGSLPLKKSVLQLMFDVFNTTQRKYGNLENQSVANVLLDSWFSAGTTELRHEALLFQYRLESAFYSNVISEIWYGYHELLETRGLKFLEKSTWLNNTGRNLSTWDDFNAFRTFLLDMACSRPGLREVIPEASDLARKPFTDKSLRCFPKFLIRYNNYNETVYKTFVRDISTIIYHELIRVGFCLGIQPEIAAERDQKRSRLAEQVRAIMQQILDARAVLGEDPPTRPTRPTTTATGPTFTPPGPASDQFERAIAEQAGNVAGLATLSWIERPGKYREILDRSIGQLRKNYSGVTFSVAMYLPYAKGDKSQHCFDGISLSGNNVNGGNYVLKQIAGPRDKQNALLAGSDLVSEMNALLDYVFSGGDDLCTRVKSKLGITEAGKGGLPGFAAVACGKKFVWYQLGYKYFAAAAVGGDARVINSTSVDAYNANCGQIIFFP